MAHRLNPVLKLLHELAPERRSMQLLPRAIERHLGPWIGMTPDERIRCLTRLDLEILEEALEERLAIIQADSSTTSGGGMTEPRGS